MAIHTESKLWIYIMISIYKAGICKIYGCVKNIKILNTYERADELTMKVGDKTDSFDIRIINHREDWVICAKYFFKLCQIYQPGREMYCLDQFWLMHVLNKRWSITPVNFFFLQNRMICFKKIHSRKYFGIQVSQEIIFLLLPLWLSHLATSPKRG